MTFRDDTDHHPN